MIEQHILDGGKIGLLVYLVGGGFEKQVFQLDDNWGNGLVAAGSSQSHLSIGNHCGCGGNSFTQSDMTLKSLNPHLSKISEI